MHRKCKVGGGYARHASFVFKFQELAGGVILKKKVNVINTRYQVRGTFQKSVRKSQPSLLFLILALGRSGLVLKVVILFLFRIIVYSCNPTEVNSTCGIIGKSRNFGRQPTADALLGSGTQAVL